MRRWLCSIGLLVIATCGFAANSYALTWDNAPLACLPKRAAKWDGVADKEPCHCPPKSMCPTTVDEWDDPDTAKMPIDLMARCCSMHCPAGYNEYVFYREVPIDAYGEGIPSGGGIFGRINCDDPNKDPYLDCDDTDLGNGFVKVPFYVCTNGECNCNNIMKLGRQSRQCQTLFIVQALYDFTTGAPSQAVIDDIIDHNKELYPPNMHNGNIGGHIPSANRVKFNDIIPEKYAYIWYGAWSWTYFDTSCSARYGREGCVLKGTPVTLADGTKKNVEELKIGDELKTHDGTAGITALNVFTQLFDELYGINGGKPFITKEHPILTTEGWKSIKPNITSVKSNDLKIVGALKVGDKIVTSNGELEVKSIERHKLDQKPTTYNIKTDKDDSFIANDVVVRGFNKVQIHY